jgi:hypothetical protein
MGSRGHPSFPPDSVVVSFRSACVYGEDAELLRPGGWLNDALVVWWAEVLTSRADGTRPPPFVVVQPATVMLATLLLLSDEVPEALEGLALPSYPLVLFPVNNSEDPSSPASGSHWSLLAYTAAGRRFVHFDSSRGTNAAAARRVATVMRPVLEGSSEAAAASTPLVVEEPSTTPQQSNAYDCGVHMLAAMEHFCSEQLGGGGGGPLASAADLAQVTTPARIHAYRQMLLETLLEMGRGQVKKG